MISTHALREEGDRREVLLKDKRFDFYPRPPRGGRRLLSAAQLYGCVISTHALREEGDLKAHWATDSQTISTHALREEGDGRRPAGRRDHLISTHALREEGDAIDIINWMIDKVFLPTPSARRATGRRPGLWPRR